MTPYPAHDSFFPMISSKFTAAGLLEFFTSRFRETILRKEIKNCHILTAVINSLICTSAKSDQIDCLYGGNSKIIKKFSKLHGEKFVDVLKTILWEIN